MRNGSSKMSAREIEESREVTLAENAGMIQLRTEQTTQRVTPHFRPGARG